LNFKQAVRIGKPAAGYLNPTKRPMGLPTDKLHMAWPNLFNIVPPKMRFVVMQATKNTGKSCGHHLQEGAGY
jgi:hypothetical protein